MYKASAQAGGAAPGGDGAGAAPGGEQGGKGGKDNVVDAEFVDVDDKK
jgi:hypothetical protein